MLPIWPSATVRLGFWDALREVFGSTREQRCWFHKTGNVLNAMPKSVQAKAKGHLHDIWQAETKTDAEAAFDFFVETYGVKYDKAVAKLIKDREYIAGLLRLPRRALETHQNHEPYRKHLCNRPAPHWQNQGMSQPENRPRHGVQADDVSSGKWRKLDGANRMPEIIEGIEFKDGIKQLQQRRLITPSPTFGHSSLRALSIHCTLPNVSSCAMDFLVEDAEVLSSRDTPRLASVWDDRSGHPT